MSAVAFRAKSQGDKILAALADPARPPLAFLSALVVAHPDDETIGCGAQLPRFSDLRIIHVTDGAPKNGADAFASGFSGPAEYAAARHAELAAAMALAGIPPEKLVALGWPDQQASLHLAEIAADLTGRLAATDVVLTHAYEGGHPDHDATAFAVHAARALLARGRSAAPVILEMPLYRAGQGRMPQSFAPVADAPEVELQLSAEERRLKRAMLAAFASQAGVLSWFTSDAERFRTAPAYGFSELPNGGDLFYERWDWGMTGERWLKLAQAALAELGLRARA
jgi:LmbE family N-acetylglucosaminyl deacetylase